VNKVDRDRAKHNVNAPSLDKNVVARLHFILLGSRNIMNVLSAHTRTSTWSPIYKSGNWWLNRVPPHFSINVSNILAGILIFL
jgi:hypothetical protein